MENALYSALHAAGSMKAFQHFTPFEQHGHPLTPSVSYSKPKQLTCEHCPSHTQPLSRPQCLLPAAARPVKTPNRLGSRSEHSSAAHMRPCLHPTAVLCGRCCRWQCSGCWDARRQCRHQTGDLQSTCQKVVIVAACVSTEMSQQTATWLKTLLACNLQAYIRLVACTAIQDITQ
jgi:hypothetical protein